MNKIKSKLKSNDGISILVALVGFMVAAMVSVVIVTAAVTSAQRVINDRTTTQNRLTLESAAQLLQKEMEQVAYTKVTRDYKSDYESEKIKDYTRYYIGNLPNIETEPEYPTTETITDLTAGSDTDKEPTDDIEFFNLLVLRAVKKIDDNTSPETYSFTFSVNGKKDETALGDGSTGSEIKDVTVNFTMFSASDTATALDKYGLKFILKSGNNAVCILMQRHSLSNNNDQPFTIGRWEDVIDKTTNTVTGQNYVEYYTQTNNVYGWEVISTQVTEASDETTTASP